jgi:hypothetical protein
MPQRSQLRDGQPELSLPIRRTVAFYPKLELELALALEQV